MDANQLIEEVGRTLESNRLAAPGTYLLFVENGEIRLGLSSLFWKSGYQIAVLRSADVNEGPTPRTWARIEANIRILKKQGVL